MRNHAANLVLTSLGAAGAGAALMFFFDPDRGAKRRSFVRNKTASLARETERSISKAARDLTHRTQGLMAETRSVLETHSNPVDDSVLVERIRSKIGRVVSHPSAIQISAQQGCVRLEGDILQSETRQLLSCVSAIHGVNSVQNDLKPHAKQAGVPSLQAGKSNGQTARPRLNPAPGTRLLLASLGGALTVYGAIRQGAAGKLLEAAGVGLLGGELADPGLKLLSRKLL
jgi:hypothetical protein